MVKTPLMSEACETILSHLKHMVKNSMGQDETAEAKPFQPTKQRKVTGHTTRYSWPPCPSRQLSRTPHHSYAQETVHHTQNTGSTEGLQAKKQNSHRKKNKPMIL